MLLKLYFINNMQNIDIFEDKASEKTKIIRVLLKPHLNVVENIMPLNQDERNDFLFTSATHSHHHPATPFISAAAILLVISLVVH